MADSGLVFMQRGREKTKRVTVLTVHCVCVYDGSLVKSFVDGANLNFQWYCHPYIVHGGFTEVLLSCRIMYFR